MRGVARPTWRASSDQKRLINVVNRAIEHADEVARREEDKIWAAAKLARDSGIPDTQLCKLTGLTRSTLQRRLGPREDDHQGSPAE